jgi:hypothetical protein
VAHQVIPRKGVTEPNVRKRYDYWQEVPDGEVPIEVDGTLTRVEPGRRESDNQPEPGIGDRADGGDDG